MTTTKYAVCETTSGRRLQALDASTIANQWRGDLVGVQTPPTVHRRWMPATVGKRSLINPPQYKLSVARHSFLPEVDFETGRWYTLRTESMPLRLSVVFTGLPDQYHTKLVLEAFDGKEPVDPTQRQVRYTRFCEYGHNCQRQCSMIGTPHPSNNAMLRNTLELEQAEVLRACPYDVHLWVPFDSDADRCVGIEYITLADGIRGQFAKDTVCTRDIQYENPSPPPMPPPFPPRPLLPHLNLTYSNLTAPPTSPPSPHTHRHIPLVAISGGLWLWAMLSFYYIYRQRYLDRKERLLRAI